MWWKGVAGGREGWWKGGGGGRKGVVEGRGWWKWHLSPDRLTVKHLV